MRPLVIDAGAKRRITDVICYAEENRITKSEMMEIIENGGPEGDSTAVGDDGNRCCYIDHGFKVVYSIEEQPIGWCHHLSVSVAALDKLPNIAAVARIMSEFGIKASMEDCHVYIEKSTPESVNVISKI